MRAGHRVLGNTPPSNRHGREFGQSARAARAGLDWLEWCSYGSWNLAGFRELRAVLDRAQAAAQAAGGETVITIGEESVAVQSAGVRRGLYCRWALIWQGVEIAIVDRALKSDDRFSVHVIARSLICMDVGQGVYARVCRFLETLGYTQAKTVVSRVDLACDLVGVEAGRFVEAFEAGAVVRRARHWATYGEGLGSSGVTFGKSAVMLRIYDKLLEMRKGGDVAKFEVLVENRWNGDQRPEGGATRVEFQLKRDVLRAMGFDDVPKLLGNLREVCRWCTEDWCRFTDGVSDRTHTDRCESSDLWKQVQAALFEAFRSGDQRPITWRRPLRAIPRKLMEQAAGVVSSSLALLDMVPETVQEVGQAVSALFVGFSAVILQGARTKRALLETSGPFLPSLAVGGSHGSG